MTKAIVYHFEVIQICKQYCNFTCLLACTSQGMPETIHEQCSVRKIGKRIMKCLILQFLLQSLALSYILEGNYSAQYLVALNDRSADILNRKMRAVFSPQHFVVPAKGGPGFEDRIDWALFRGIGSPVRF